MKSYLKAGVIALCVAGIGVAFAGRDGSGTYTLPAGNPVSTGTTISSTWANTTLTDIATALSNSIAKDGQTVATANLPMGTFKHTNVGNASARNHYAAAGQVQDFSLQTLGSVSGTNTITGSLNPAITAYAPGMVVVFEVAITNTGSATIAINGLAATLIAKENNAALIAGDLIAGTYAALVYDSTSNVFSLLNPKSATLNTGVAISDLARLSVANTFTAAQTISATASQFIQTETDAAANEKQWEWRADGGQLNLYTRNDASSAVATPITIDRTGTTVDSINLQATAVQVNGNAVIGPLAAGTYTPTATNTTNVTGCTPGAHNYMRVGSTVTVSGNVSCSSSASGDISIGISLPVASAFTTLSDLGGAGGSTLGTGVLRGIAASIAADATNDRASIASVATGAGTVGFLYTFTYTVK